MRLKGEARLDRALTRLEDLASKLALLDDSHRKATEGDLTIADLAARTDRLEKDLDEEMETRRQAIDLANKNFTAQFEAMALERSQMDMTILTYNKNFVELTQDQRQLQAESQATAGKYSQVAEAVTQNANAISMLRDSVLRQVNELTSAVNQHGLAIQQLQNALSAQVSALSGGFSQSSGSPPSGQMPHDSRFDEHAMPTTVNSAPRAPEMRRTHTDSGTWRAGDSGHSASSYEAREAFVDGRRVEMRRVDVPSYLREQPSHYVPPVPVPEFDFRDDETKGVPEFRRPSQYVSRENHRDNYFYRDAGASAVPGQEGKPLHPRDNLPEFSRHSPVYSRMHDPL